MVRAVNSEGIIATIAGTGISCTDPLFSCGDGESATLAQLNYPMGGAVTSNGTLDFVDGTRVRRVKLADVKLTDDSSNKAMPWIPLLLPDK